MDRRILGEIRLQRERENKKESVIDKDTEMIPIGTRKETEREGE